MTGAQARNRYLFLLFLRWFPVGLWVPIVVLLPLDRGLTLAEAGLAASLQGFVVLALELPTGGLSDSWGRRPVLLLSSVVGLASVVLLIFADSFAMFALVWVLQGIYRALDSGPLESWFVDATLAADPDAKLERGLSAGGTVAGVAIGTGALVTSGIVAWVQLPGVPTLVQPVLLILALQVAGFAALALLVREAPHPNGKRSLLASVRDVPKVIAEGTRIVRGSRVLLCLLGVSLCWGFGMVTFEVLMPVRLSELVGSEEQAAALTGPVSAAAWFVNALGAAAITLLTARIGVGRTAVLLPLLQGGAIVVMGLAAGPAGVIAAHLVCYAAHGARGPVGMTLLHREVTSAHRSTVMSISSMVWQPAGALGQILLTLLASGVSTGIAIVAGGVVLALAAPLYLPAVRAERRQPTPV
ncbi:MFS transporter [Actinophytocola sp. NPDC049390]|uniref:MFS transporter n=1 Tax=Actinophytocola sp. NPDC049390 TaxID=3363894 RepID=UPI0037BB17EA